MKVVVWLPRSLSAVFLRFMKAAVLLFFMKSVALAEEERFVLTWNAPVGCPTEAEVTTAVLNSVVLSNTDSNNAASSDADPPSLAAGAPERATGPALIASAQVSQRSPGSTQATWHVLLRTQRGGARGQREIEAESCASLAQATAVVLSLALLDLQEDSASESSSQSLPTADFDANRADSDEPVSAETPSPTDSTSLTATQPRAAQTTPSEQIPVGTPLPSNKHSPPENRDSSRSGALSQSKNDPSLARFSVGVGAGFNVGTLPQLAPGGLLSLAWLPDRFRLEFEAGIWGRQSQSIEETSAGADLSLSSFGARACLKAPLTSHLDLSPCLGSQLYLLRARGFGSDSNYSTRASWPALTGGLLGRAELSSRLALRADVEAQLPLDRPRFLVERLGTVHRIPPWAVTTLFGVEIHFP